MNPPPNRDGTMPPPPPPPTGDGAYLPPPPPGSPIYPTGTFNPNISPGATTGTNTVTNSGSTNVGNPSDPSRWGIWAHDIFFIHKQNPSGTTLDSITQSVTGLPLLNHNLNNLAASYVNFGVVNYGGAAFGHTQMGTIHRDDVGNFTAQIDFANRHLNNLTINIGGFTMSGSGSGTNLNNITLTGTAQVPASAGITPGAISVGGSADSALFGVNADLYSGNYHAVAGSNPTVNANGIFVGGKQ
jgi:hypothetical protein